jgi:hypothetical protein
MAVIVAHRSLVPKRFHTAAARLFRVAMIG